MKLTLWQSGKCWGSLWGSEAAFCRPGPDPRPEYESRDPGWGRWCWTTDHWTSGRAADMRKWTRRTCTWRMYHSTLVQLTDAILCSSSNCKFGTLQTTLYHHLVITLNKIKKCECPESKINWLRGQQGSHWVLLRVKYNYTLKVSF